MNQYRQKLQCSAEAFPDLPHYIQLCTVFNHSGANRFEITIIFDEYMQVEDYDREEREELLNYLYAKAQE